MGQRRNGAEDNKPKLTTPGELPGTDLESLDAWPPVMRELVTKFGGQRVWNVGLTILKWPPTWAHESQTARRVAEALLPQGN